VNRQIEELGRQLGEVKGRLRELEEREHSVAERERRVQQREQQARQPGLAGGVVPLARPSAAADGLPCMPYDAIALGRWPKRIRRPLGSQRGLLAGPRRRRAAPQLHPPTRGSPTIKRVLGFVAAAAVAGVLVDRMVMMTMTGTAARRGLTAAAPRATAMPVQARAGPKTAAGDGADARRAGYRAASGDYLLRVDVYIEQPAAAPSALRAPASGPDLAALRAAAEADEMQQQLAAAVLAAGALLEALLALARYPLLACPAVEAPALDLSLDYHPLCGMFKSEHTAPSCVGPRALSGSTSLTHSARGTVDASAVCSTSGVVCDGEAPAVMPLHAILQPRQVMRTAGAARAVIRRVCAAAAMPAAIQRASIAEAVVRWPTVGAQGLGEQPLVPLPRRLAAQTAAPSRPQMPPSQPRLLPSSPRPFRARHSTPLIQEVWGEGGVDRTMRGPVRAVALPLSDASKAAGSSSAFDSARRLGEQLDLLRCQMEALPTGGALDISLGCLQVSGWSASFGDERCACRLRLRLRASGEHEDEGVGRGRRERVSQRTSARATALVLQVPCSA